MIKKIALSMITLIFVFTTLLSGCTNKGISFKESTNTDNKELQAEVIQYVDDYCEKNQFSGTILVSKGNEVLINRGYGMADYENNIINTPQTIFEIGSLTKQFTATAILMLKENNLLSLQDTLDKYIPDYPNGDKIKIYNLLTNTSGIPDYINSGAFNIYEKHTYTLEQIIEWCKNEQLIFKTGTQFDYSNSNYLLLGYIIEKVSNMTYEEYMEKNILKPLKMKDTGFLSKNDIIKDKAIGYSEKDKDSNVYKNSIEGESSLSYAAGEIYSTTEDLYRWENALTTEKLIKKDSLNEMVTPYLNGYGYGWGIIENSAGDKIITHAGDIPGYTSRIQINIDKENMIIVLSNVNQNDDVDNMYTGLSIILKNR